MAWQDLLQTGDETLLAPWTGGKVLRSEERSWDITGRLPCQHGWYIFALSGRKARVREPADPHADILRHTVKGYLVGDRLVPDDAAVDPDPAKIAGASEPVALLERGLDRFARIVAGRAHDDGPLVYKTQDFPLGTEDAVMRAYLRRAATVNDIPGVPPALDAAFRVETWARAEAERRRAEIARQRAEEEARRQREVQRRELEARLGSGQGRRAMAVIDFQQAATAALLVGGAEYLEHRAAPRRGEMVVTFRLLRRTFACVCDERTLRIIDAGICLVDHRTGEKGDTRFTLESLPAVIREADRLGVLVVLRHTGYDDD